MGQGLKIFLCICYRSFSIRRVQQAEKNYESLSEKHRKYIPTFQDHLDMIRACIDHNYEIIKLIIKDAESVFENKKQEGLNVSLFNGFCKWYFSWMRFLQRLRKKSHFYEDEVQNPYAKLRK